MQCHICGTEVQPEHKFCVECGARLSTGSAPTWTTTTTTTSTENDTVPATSSATGIDESNAAGSAKSSSGEVPIITTSEPAPANSFSSGKHPMFDPITGQLLISPGGAGGATDPDAATSVLPRSPGPSSPFAPPDPTPGGGNVWPQPRPAEATSRQPQAAATRQMARQEPNVGYGGYEQTNLLPVTYSPWEGDDPYVDDDGAGRRASFRVKPLFVLTIVTVATALTSMFLTTVTVSPGSSDQYPLGPWMVNDFGTNMTVGGIVATVAMLTGALAWCWGMRWGAGLAGGGGAALAGWSALVVGLAEVPLADGARLGAGFTGTRELGYWVLVAAGGLGLLTLLVSLARANYDGRSGLDPWVAALGAMAAIVAVVGPLIPLAGADVMNNVESLPGTDLPSMFFIARFVQLGLLLFCGIFGFLLVRRYGLGLAIGGAVVVGWLTLTSATEQTSQPIGSAYGNPGTAFSRPLQQVDQPHIVTVVGVGLLFFFALVATAMALIDSDR